MIYERNHCAQVRHGEKEENMSFIDRLRETQHDSKNPELFEEALTEAFRQLGARATHKGGANEPDVLLEISGHSIVVEAKTTQRGAINEAYINFDALERYEEGYKADALGVVAVGFSKGNVRDTAEKRGVALIETEAICKALENHMAYPYDPQCIYEMLFKSNKTVITSEDIDPSTRDVSEQIELIKQILLALKRLGQSNFNDILAICRYGIRSDIRKEDIEDAFTFLSSPPLNIVKEEDGVYSLTLGFDEMVKRLALLYKAVPTPPTPAPSRREPERLGPEPKLLRHVLEVVKFMDQGYSHTDAFKKRAKLARIGYSSVSSACTRNLGLGTSEFTKIARGNRDDLISILAEGFPGYKDLIAKELK
ncbi:MAG: hypothetical protein U9M97_04305 [Candidatus Hadarchaeota archaeon]|nr:hypothetical protein [Candidatus Hadarchaeota archaeon]